jgi:hypothetical protein
LGEGEKDILERRRDDPNGGLGAADRVQSPPQDFEIGRVPVVDDMDGVAEGMGAPDAGQFLQDRERGGQRRRHFNDGIPHSGNQGLRSVVGEQPAVQKKSHPAAAGGFVHVRRREDDRHALVVQKSEETPQLPPGNRVDARRRLVE